MTPVTYRGCDLCLQGHIVRPRSVRKVSVPSVIDDKQTIDALQRYNIANIAP